MDIYDKDRMTKLNFDCFKAGLQHRREEEKNVLTPRLFDVLDISRSKNFMGGAP
jgi:hypothetical protein